MYNIYPLIHNKMLKKYISPEQKHMCYFSLIHKKRDKYLRVINIKKNMPQILIPKSSLKIK